ncbi:AraC family transcriptional regulator ligand-binding domain-containing protein [Thalassotalea psychrophila]|uniref:AraC family transcriptional regulator ligand-binding domain-containing protein n=1 Tax=Thalassotalea psychrophila TaxID=3065647 RepID=A0ABY9TYI5_9GAMM|nr:AraC family transcriptional regulator ligand-binding domain-containing protein [Colwelliaceae bacterium SQ149]
MNGLPTTSRGNVMALYQALESYGVNPEAIIKEVGIELPELSDNNRVVTAEMMDKLLYLAVRSTGDEAFGLRFADFIKPTSYHALGMALLYSPTLRSFCQRLERYFAMITTLDIVTFTESKQGCYLSTTAASEYSDITKRCHSDAWSAWIVNLIRLIYSQNYFPSKVSLFANSESQQERYQQLFGDQITFSASETRIYFEPKTLDMPLPTSNAELARANDKVVIQFLSQLNEADIAVQVQAKLIEQLPSGQCSKENIAEQLHLTERTLHNKLNGAGTSYHKLLLQTRQSLAQEYIKSNEVSLSEIAYLLGFTSISSFSRAFKQWTGISPRKYQKQVLTEF